MLVLILCHLLLFAQPQSSTMTLDVPSLVRQWQWSASCDSPATSLEGTFEVGLDSLSYLTGTLKLNGRTLPFHGRHIERRLLIRTDPGQFPIIRIDLTPDSAGATLSGVLQISKLEAKLPRKKPQLYHNLIFQLYVVPREVHSKG